jgi:Fic family protein
MYDAVLAQLGAKKRQLNDLRSTAAPSALDGLEHTQRIDITYASNAIEGNALTAGETALVVEKGITCGKRLKDHVEAVDHYQALDWVSGVATRDAKFRKIRSITEPTIRSLNFMLLRRIRGDDHLTYTDLPKGSSFHDRMTWVPPSVLDLCAWLKNQTDTPDTAARAYDRLTAMRPFAAANGPTARLLLNYILLRGGYPPVAIRPGDIEHTATNSEPLIYQRLDETLDIYLAAARQAQDAAAGTTPTRT